MKKAKSTKSTKNKKATKVSKSTASPVKSASAKQKSCNVTSCWKISSIVLAILLIAVLILGFTGVMFSGQEGLSQSAAESRANEFVNLLSNQDMPLSVVSVERESGAFEIVVEVMGQRENWFMSADGEYLFPSAFSLQDIEMLVGQQQMQTGQEPQEVQDTIENAEVEGLVSCLANNDFVIYGADWCGYTTQVVDLFGGVDIGSIYVECTEEEALCQEQQIRGYPTIRIEGEDANVERSLEGFASATDCLN